MRVIKASDMEVACEVLSRGGLVAFPTETVYGLGGNAYDDAVVSEIFRCKGRDRSNPVSVCYSSFEKASDDVEITEEARGLARAFLPGPLTIVLKKKKTSEISSLCSAGGDTIGIRVPDNQITLELLSKLDFPLAAPSANKSHELSATTAESVCESLKDCDLMVLDGGSCPLGIESTVVAVDYLHGNKVQILREGAVSRDDILRCLSVNCSDDYLFKKDNEFTKKRTTRHYRPFKPLVINVNSVSDDDALLAFGTPIGKARYCLNLSEKADLSEAAHNLYSMLRKLDRTDAARICVMPIPEVGVGKAINDRLRRAAL